MSARIFVPQDRIAAICQQYHINRLALFGSVLRQDFRPDSDIDVLVEFASNHVPSGGPANTQRPPSILPAIRY